MRRSAMVELVHSLLHSFASLQVSDIPTSFDGIIVGGAIQLDQPIPLADHCRVHVTVVPVEQTTRQWDEALQTLAKLKTERPIGSAGLRFSREELHERR